MGDDKRVAKTVKKLKRQKIGWKWKTDWATHFYHPIFGPRGGIKGGVNPPLGMEGLAECWKEGKK